MYVPADEMQTKKLRAYRRTLLEQYWEQKHYVCPLARLDAHGIQQSVRSPEVCEQLTINDDTHKTYTQVSESRHTCAHTYTYLHDCAHT